MGRRRGINQPNLSVVGEVGGGIEAIELYRRLLPDMTLMDLQMPDMDGIECITRIRYEFPATRILVLTTFGGDMLARRALQAGACAYALKQAGRADLVEHMTAVHQGMKRLQPEIAADIAVHTGHEPLTGREIQVLSLVAAGNSNKRIAARLFINGETVKGHLKSIFAKLRASDRTHAVTKALRRGIIQL